jgi:hypothetical protein
MLNASIPRPHKRSTCQHHKTEFKRQKMHNLCPRHAQTPCS